MSREKSIYDDIINLPHHVSATRPPMSMENRAAQFSAFAALSNFDAAIVETARATDKRVILDEEAKSILNTKLHIIEENMSELHMITVTYYRADEKKDGGAYLTISDSIKKIDKYERALVTASGYEIPFENIYSIEGDVFHHLENDCE
jgi:hypothetical protein